MGVAQDITERRLAEKNLLSKQHKLAELELELSFAEERERQRIAAVLHDHIGQLLLLGRIKLGALLSAGQPPATEQTVSDVRTLLDEAIQSTRSLTVQLCPPVLSTMGLEPALELLCRQMLEEWELQVAFSDDLQPKPLSPEMRTVLYQAARELLINVGKHAGTRQARLAISRDDGMFLLTVDDNGTGFDPDALAAASRQAKGFGLFNVMRRIRNLGGELTMDSSPLQGTRIVIRIPLESTEEDI
jgi:signal transduction histidine kinase